MRTRNGHVFGEVLMMGSVWWFPSGAEVTNGCSVLSSTEWEISA